MITVAEINDSYRVSAGDASAAYFHRIYHSGQILHGTGANPSGTVKEQLWRVLLFQAVIVDPATDRVYDGQAIRLLSGTQNKGSAIEVTEGLVQGSGYTVKATVPFVTRYGIGVQVHAPMTAGDELRVQALVEVLQ